MMCALVETFENCCLLFELIELPKFECYCYFAVKCFQTKSVRAKKTFIFKQRVAMKKIRIFLIVQTLFERFTK